MMFTWENEENGMGVVMEKQLHPYKLTQKITSKNGRGFFFFFGGGFPRDKERRDFFL